MFEWIEDFKLKVTSKTSSLLYVDDQCSFSDFDLGGEGSEDDLREDVLFEIDSDLVKNTDDDVAEYSPVPTWAYCIAAIMLVGGILSAGMLITGTGSVRDATANLMHVHDVHKTSSDVDASTFTDGAVKHVVLFLGDYNDRYAVKEFCGKVMKRRMQSQKHIQKALKREYKEAREDIVDSHKQSSAYIPDVDFLSSIQLDYCDNNFAVIASVMNKYGMSPTGPWYGSRAENMLKLPAPNSAAQHYALLIGPAIKALEMLTGNRVTHVVASSNYYDIGRTYVWESHFNADENDFWSHTVIPQWKAHWQGFVDFATSLVPNDEILWHTSNMPLCPDEAAPNSFVSPWLVQCKRVDELNTAVRQTIGNNPRVKLLDFEESLKLVQPNEYLLSDKEHLNRKFLAILMQNCLTALGLNMRFG